MYNEFLEKYNLIKNQENIHDIEIKSDMDIMNSVKRIADKNPLVVFGCGMGGSIFFDWVKYIDIPVVAVCDSYKAGENFKGYIVLSPEKAVETYKNAYFFISATGYYKKIFDMLRKLGIPESHILDSVDSLTPPPDLISPEYFEQTYLRGYQWAYDFFQDKHSKQVVLSRIALYLYGTPLKASSTSPQYFDKDIVFLQENEVFVDGGGYKGDSFLSFQNEMNKAKLNWKCIHSFEPDKRNFELISHEFPQIHNIKIIPKELWSKTCKLQFIVNVTSAVSHFADYVSNNTKSAETEKEEVPVISLDEYFSEYPEADWPTFIKMDIEGSEKEALIGAEKIIKTKHPKLAICAYHKPEDIYELTQLIYQYAPDYKFFLRQCANGFFETVLYAIT